MSSYQYWQLPPKEQRKDESSLTLKTANQIPQPAPNEVLIRIHAVSLNYRDLIIARNLYPLAVMQEELIPGSDGAGEVVSVGDKVHLWQKGDRVAANFSPAYLKGATATEEEWNSALGGPAHGVLSQYVVLPANGLVRIPDHLSYEEASTLPCAGVTAWNGLFGSRDVPLLPGQTVLLEGTGGVSVFGAQYAIAAGVRAIITSSSDDKLNKVKSLFTAEQQKRLFTINYKTTPDWDKEALKITHGQGVSHVIEVGGAGTLEKAHNALQRGGVVANIGFVAQGEMPNVAAFNLGKNSFFRGINVGSVELFKQMNACIDAHQIKPTVDKVFAFEDAPEAYAHQWSGAHVGNVVIKV